MKIDFNGMTRRFLMGEGQQKTSPHALLQALNETIRSLRPSSRTDENRIAVAVGHIREITRSFRKLQEQVNVLEEQINILEEASSNAGGSVEGASGGAWSELDVEGENKKAKKESHSK